MNKTISIFFLSSMVFCLLSINVFVYNNPKFSRKALAGQYQMFSEQVSPNSIQAKRYGAIADALRKGKNTYNFNSNRIPAVNSQ